MNDVTVSELRRILFEVQNQNLTIEELRKKLFDEPDQNRKATDFIIKDLI